MMGGDLRLIVKVEVKMAKFQVGDKVRHKDGDKGEGLFIGIFMVTLS